MRSIRRRHAYTYGDYLMLEAEAPALRHEFIDGEIVAMAGGSDLHSALIAALSGELYSQLRGSPCGLRESNLRVRVQATGNAFYADALVVCGEADIVHEIRGVIRCSIRPRSWRCSPHRPRSTIAVASSTTTTGSSPLYASSAGCAG